MCLSELRFLKDKVDLLNSRTFSEVRVFFYHLMQRFLKRIVIPTELRIITANWKNIVHDCRRGDHQAQCKAYQLSWRIIYPVVYDFLRNREEAEDVIQESLIKGFWRLNELKEEDKYLAWQRRISANLALNKLKTMKVYQLFLMKIWLQRWKSMIYRM